MNWRCQRKLFKIIIITTTTTSIELISTLLSSANDKLPAKIYLSKHYSPIMLYISQKYLIFWFWISERYQKDWSVDVYGHKCLSCHGQYFKSIIAIGQLGTHETMRPWDSFRPQVYLVPIKAYSGIFFRYSLNGQKKLLNHKSIKCLNVEHTGITFLPWFMQSIK